jgi:DNA-binding LytR/AlgR family response regulator
MKVLIIEDEEVAVRNLKRLLLEAQPDIEVVDIVPSISEAVEWFLNPKPIDLIFLDIQLSDGNSFEIFRQIQIETPVIFTTAFDEYALKAFELNSVDYLLKPIHQNKLEKALEKYKNHHQTDKNQLNYAELITHYANSSAFKTRFLVKSGLHLISIEKGQIAYFMKDGILLLVTHDNHRYAINFSLDELEKCLNPDDFFRINRKLIIHRNSIRKVTSYFKGKLKIELVPTYESEIIVSQERASLLKKWLGA